MERRYQPPMGVQRYEQERRLVASTADWAWVDRRNDQILRDAEREAGQTIGHALTLAAQLKKDKQLTEYKLK